MGGPKTSKNLDDVWPDLSSLFPLPDSSPLTDDSAPWDGSGPTDQTRESISQSTYPDKSSVFRKCNPNNF